jgi:hypothetical protein
LRPASAARSASRENQRASSISAGSIAIASLSACATQPSMSEHGNGHGCDAR